MHNTHKPKDLVHQLPISTWRSWPITLSQPPTVQAEILGGKTNRTYLLTTTLPRHPKLLLRLFSKHSEDYGICRTSEHSIHIAVAKIGLAPAIIHWDNNIGFCVMELLEGVPWIKSNFDDPNKSNELSQAIKSYQQLSIEGLSQFDYLGHLDHYANLAFDALNKVQQREWLSFRFRLAHWQKAPWTRKLTHHDLIAENIIDCADGLKIIDWEYAGLGHPVLDWLDLPEDTGCNQEDFVFLRNLRQWLESFWRLI